MKKIIVLLIMTMIVTFGCTRIPDSVETGVKPGEYEGLKNTDELKKENDSLSKDIESTKEQLDKLKEDYLSLAKSNDEMQKRLSESDELLKSLQDGGMPKFSTESTDRNKILEYLLEKKSMMDKNFRGLDILPVPTNDNIILFETKGYGTYYNQLFIWEPGSKEPVMVEGAHRDVDGGWSWLISGKFLMINTSSKIDCDKIVIDVAAKKVINTVKSCSNDYYAIPDTTSIIMQKAVNGLYSYMIYDYLTGEEKSMSFAFDYQNKNLKFKVNEENKEIIFTVTYEDTDGTEYDVQAVMKIDKIKEKYSVKPYAPATASNPAGEEGKTEEKKEGSV